MLSERDDTLAINLEDLTEEFSEQASRYAYHASLSADAVANEKRAKDELERTKATIEIRIRGEQKKAGEKSTEGLINSLVLIDSEYIRVEERYREFATDALHAKARADAWRMRADMLVSLGAQRRFEGEMTGLHIKTSTIEERVEQAKAALKRAKGQ